MNINFKSQKGISLIVVLIIIAVIIVGIIFIANIGNKGYKLNSKGSGEEVAYTTIRWACTKSQLGNGEANGFGTITRDQFNTLGKMVKNANSSNQWFSNVNQGVGVKLADTSQYEVVIIDYGDYTATLTIDASTKDYYLVDYKFEYKKGNGTIVIIKD